MVRCNRAPEGMLVEMGRALPKLTDAIKYSLGHQLHVRQRDDEGNENLPLRPITTPFLDGAVRRIFHAYAMPPSGRWGNTNDKEDDDNNSYTMDHEALLRWMTACLSSSLPSATTADEAFFSSSSGLGIGGATTTMTAPMTIWSYDRGMSAALF